MPTRLLAAVWGFAVLLAALYLAQTANIHYAGGIMGDPVTTYDPVLSRNAAGDWWVHPRTGNHWFTNHVTLWMYPVSLLYMLHDHASTYYAVIQVCLALAVVPLAALAWRLTGRAGAVGAASALWAFNTLTVSHVLSLHSENIVFPFWFLLMWGLVARRPWAVWCGVLGVLSVKQDQAVWLVCFALWAGVFRYCHWRMALALAAAGFGAFALFKGIMFSLPATTESEVGYYWVRERYGGIAETPTGLVLHFAAHPLDLLARLARPVWGPLLLAGGLVCLLGWRSMLLTLPPALLLLTADHEPFNRLLYYYSYPFLPPLMLAMLEGLRAAERLIPSRQRALAWLGAGVAVLGVAQLALPSRREGWRLGAYPVAPKVDAAREFVHRNVRLDDPAERVMSQWVLVAFVPRGRLRVPMSPGHLPGTTLVVVDLNGAFWDLSLAEYEAMLGYLFDEANGWRIVDRVEGLTAFRRADGPLDAVPQRFDSGKWE
ncbi:MAG: DUF2079 domain-containing protein [Candidatus Sumerlaeia bacterium]|nr:DUF2079 domain-containing protein [Candidatus Sumerlaeia bacterium]